jgi:RNA polymerase sigma-70 factor, ECF subfamily
VGVTGGEDDAIITALYQAYRAPLMAFVLRLADGDRQQAEDIVQETMVRAWCEASRLDLTASSLMPWLTVVARRIAIDEHRRKSARPAVAGECAAGDVPVDDDSAATVLRVAVADAMRQLTSSHRQILNETILRDQTVGQAARALGIPVGTAKSRVYYALRVLEAVLAERGLGRDAVVGLAPDDAAALALDDVGSLDLDRDGGQRLGGGAVDDRPVLDAEPAAVTRAVDGSVRDGADDAALVGAHRGERLERAGLGLRDHDVLAVDDLATARGDLGGGGEEVGRGRAGGGPGGGRGARARAGTRGRGSARRGGGRRGGGRLPEETAVVGVVRGAAGEHRGAGGARAEQQHAAAVRVTGRVVDLVHLVHFTAF